MSKKISYPMSSVSSGTMRNEDLIPTFCAELEFQARRKNTGVSAKERKAHLALVKEIEARMESADYYQSEDSDSDLNDGLFDALNAYSGPYFYFGAHPGDGADYGWWLSESWYEDFCEARIDRLNRTDGVTSIKVSDLSEVPSWFHGEVAVVNDHGNVTLYVKTARGLKEIWAVV